MKNFFGKNSKYVCWGLTAFIVIACGILFYFGLDYLGSMIKAIGNFMGILSPFIWGLVIAYLLMPFMSYLERKLFKPMLKKLHERYPKMKLGSKLPRVLAVLFAEIAMILLISALLYLIIPQVIDSIEAIVANSPEYINSAYNNIDRLLQDTPEIEKYARQLFGDFSGTLTNWAQNTLLPGMESVITNITSGVYYVLKAVYNIVIGIIVSVYILYNREAFRAHAKKILYCLFSAKTAQKLKAAAKFADKTFMGFIEGKLLDSAIIGVICYIGCLIMSMPYPLLIAVIVGVTNVIPFFGPFIGAVPSALLILIVDPWKCLLFVIFIIVLQQVDGNIIGPKILGGTVGINGFWVMFSIIIGAGLFGFWGMLLGVPVFVIIYTAISMLVDKKLERDGYTTETEKYIDLDYIDPDTGEFVPHSHDELVKSGRLEDDGEESKA